MNLYIDGDALPNLLKPILWRAVERLGLTTFLVSNRLVTIGQSTYITLLTVPAGADEADHRIVEMVRENDLVITADIPLADRVITKKAYAIDHRGKLFSENNIKQSLAIRNLMQEIRDSGEVTKGPAPFSQKDAHEFANRLDQFLTRHKSN